MKASEQALDLEQASGSQDELLARLSRLALGRSGADVEYIVRTARQFARRQGRALEWKDIELGLQSLTTSMSDEVLWSVAVHEAGHAVAFHMFGVAQVTAITIGAQSRGYVTVDMTKGLENEDWLMRHIACSLASREAERLIVGEMMLGSGGFDDSDLAKATSLALAAETEFGIGQVNPLIYHGLGARPDILFADKHLAARVHSRLEKAEIMARELIEQNRVTVEGLARVLFAQKIMTGDEFEMFMASEPSVRA